MKRRTFLGVAASASLPVTVAKAASLENAKTMSVQERYEFHLSEFQKAAEELDSRIGHWHIGHFASDSEMKCAIIVTAFRLTGRYEGDGIYEGGSDNWNGNRTKYKVRLLTARIDDERLFEVTSPGEKMQLLESRLNTFIGRRLS